MAFSAVGESCPTEGISGKPHARGDLTVMRVIILTMPSEKDHLLIALTVLIRQWTKAAFHGGLLPSRTHLQKQKKG